MTNFTPEMIEKAKTAKTAEELLALAKEGGIEMTEEEAKIYFAQFNPVSGELSDDELDNVAGGCGNDSSGESPAPSEPEVKKYFDVFYEGAKVKGDYCCKYSGLYGTTKGHGRLLKGNIHFISAGEWSVTCSCGYTRCNSGDPRKDGFQLDEA